MCDQTLVDLFELRFSDHVNIILVMLSNLPERGRKTRNQSTDGTGWLTVCV